MKFEHWRYERPHLIGPYDYDINLETCKTSAELLDWIFQLASKSWATPAIVGEFVLAVDALIDPQAHLCSFGQERGPIEVLPLLKRREHRLQ